MWFLTFLSYIAIAFQVLFCTISIAAGLYYLAELVEEYTTFTKKVIIWLNSGILLAYILLWIFENFPLLLIMCGIVAQLCHFWILKNFPLVTFASFEFIATLIFVVINHYLAFSYFTEVYHPFLEVITYFTLCLWLVPFSLFVSLSANDSVLPTTITKKDDVISNYFSKKNKKYGLLFLFNYASESLLGSRTKKGF